MGLDSEKKKKKKKKNNKKRSSRVLSPRLGRESCSFSFCGFVTYSRTSVARTSFTPGSLVRG